MAVQKSKKSKARRNMRRAHHALSAKTLSEDIETGEIHIRHNVSESGYYRGKDILEKDFDEEE